MAKNKKVIITCAVTGGTHTPSMSPGLPVNKQQIVDQAVAAVEAGASVVHIHGRLEDGHPTSDPAVIKEILTDIKARCDGVVSITTGGLNLTVEERFRVIDTLQPEMASCNCGTMNFNISETERLIGDSPKYDWEIPFVRQSIHNVFKNTYSDIEYCVSHMYAAGTMPEFEVFDMGHLATLNHLYKKGIVKKPIVLQFVTGVQGGIPMEISCITTLIDLAKKYFGDDVTYCMVAGGRRMYRYETMMAVLGGNVRVGLEDGLYISPDGTLAPDNASMVRKIRSALELLDFEVATPDEARQLLSLKGKDKVNF